LKKRGLEELEKIPYGIYSGLKKNEISGIFFYYMYGDDFHFWYLYDINAASIITNKTEILDFISCKPNTKRIVPNFFEKIYEVNKIIVGDIEKTYKEIELSQMQDSKLKELSQSRSTKFVKNMINEIELQIDSYLDECPDGSIEKFWEPVRDKLLSIPLTKKRLQVLRRMWKRYKKDDDWKKLIKELNNFLMEKGMLKKAIVEPFDMSKLRLITVDFIS
jgi:high-affinity nickel permease